MIHVCSYGGGVQSNAILALAAQGHLDIPLFLFANVGDDSEHPDTLRYVREVAHPYAAEHGIELVELQRRMRDGTPETLMGRIDRRERSVPIPVRMGDTGAPGNRTCTIDFKIKVITRELRRRGHDADSPATMAVGFSTDEIGRVKPSREPIQSFVYPLIERGVNRAGALRIIADAGLPQPPRSACWFCPFHSLEEWRQLKRRTPDLFARSVELEQRMLERGRRLGRGDFWLTRFARPLAQVVEGDQGVLFPDERDTACDSGACWT